MTCSNPSSERKSILIGHITFYHLFDVGIDTRPVDTLLGTVLALGNSRIVFMDLGEYFVSFQWRDDEGFCLQDESIFYGHHIPVVVVGLKCFMYIPDIVRPSYHCGLS